MEEYLHLHPDVLEAQVIGVPSERYGEEVMAWIRLGPASAVTATGLDAFCRGQIATFKIPRYWKFVEEFPMTVTRKGPEVQDARVGGRGTGPPARLGHQNGLMADYEGLEGLRARGRGELPQPQLQLGGLAHLVLVPRWLEYDIDAGVRDTLDTTHLALDVSGQRLRGRTAG